jgi:hypothetical protein
VFDRSPGLHLHLQCSPLDHERVFCSTSTQFVECEIFINTRWNCCAFQLQYHSCRLIEKVAESVRYSCFVRLLSKRVYAAFKLAQIPKGFRLGFSKDKRFSNSVFAH